MENFFIETDFYPDIESYLSDIEMEDIDIINLKDDWKVKIELTKLGPIFQYKIDHLVSDIINGTDRWDDRFPEDSDTIFKELEFAVKQSIDLDKLNSLIPKLYYPSGEFYELTKKDLLYFIAYTPPTEPKIEY